MNLLTITKEKVKYENVVYEFGIFFSLHILTSQHIVFFSLWECRWLSMYGCLIRLYDKFCMERTTINWLAILSIGTVHSNRFALSLQTEEKLKKPISKWNPSLLLLFSSLLPSPLHWNPTTLLLSWNPRTPTLASTTGLGCKWLDFYSVPSRTNKIEIWLNWSLFCSAIDSILFPLFFGK